MEVSLLTTDSALCPLPKLDWVFPLVSERLSHGGIIARARLSFLLTVVRFSAFQRTIQHRRFYSSERATFFSYHHPTLPSLLHLPANTPSYLLHHALHSWIKIQNFYKLTPHRMVLEPVLHYSSFSEVILLIQNSSSISTQPHHPQKKKTPTPPPISSQVRYLPTYPPPVPFTFY